jgi:hypothetical protein
MIASSGHGTAVAPQERPRPDRTDRGHERWALLSLCPGGRLNRAASAIYAGQDALWSLYNGVGGAAAAVGYAHEWGHHIQNVTGGSGAGDARGKYRPGGPGGLHCRRLVQQAAQSGYLEYPADLGGTAALLAAIAPPDAGEPAAPVQERISALLHDYSDGVPGCNAFFSDTPVSKG